MKTTWKERRQTLKVIEKLAGKVTNPISYGISIILWKMDVVFASKYRKSMSCIYYKLEKKH
ncbi:MAG: hypothetical protein II670_09010 [Alphaproteobacteria bacterium]|nr:hypothetical protein [Alphaproteobacteria bacterium]